MEFSVLTSSPESSLKITLLIARILFFYSFGYSLLHLNDLTNSVKGLAKNI